VCLINLRNLCICNLTGHENEEMSKAVGHRARIPHSTMAPRARSSDAMIMSNTSHHIGIQGSNTWEEMCNMFCSGKFLENNPDLKVYQNIQKSGIHTVVTWLAVLPYSEVPMWAYKNMNTQAQVIMNRKGNVIAPLNPYSFHKIYKLPKPLVFLNKGFMDKFIVEKSKPLELIQDWWDEETPFTTKINRVYNTQYFKSPYQLLISMICILYGEENCIHFKQEWTMMVHKVVETRVVFSWALILSSNIYLNVHEARKGNQPVFYMSTFLLDAICQYVPNP